MKRRVVYCSTLRKKIKAYTATLLLYLWISVFILDITKPTYIHIHIGMLWFCVKLKSKTLILNLPNQDSCFIQQYGFQVAVSSFFDFNFQINQLEMGFVYGIFPILTGHILLETTVRLWELFHYIHFVKQLSLLSWDLWSSTKTGRCGWKGREGGRGGGR